ncbi:MAG: ribbon-helix-helix protein, CopG family [Luteolibacter sp.]
MIVSLDEATAERLRRLAATWRVSQAEVVRRAVAEVDKAILAKKPNPAALLRAFHARGGLELEKADAYLAEVYENRKHWRGE